LLIAALWMGYERQAVPPMDMAQVDAQMLQDLPVLEDHDVLSNFEPLKELPPPVQQADDDSSDTNM
jgi:hypothetical protein